MTVSDEPTQPIDRILKAGTYRAAVRRLVDRPGDVTLEADVVQALDSAEAIVTAAQAEAARLSEQARQEGLARGLQQAAAVLDQAEAARREAVRRSQRDVLTLAMATAKKLIGHTLETEREVIVELVERAMAEARDSRQIVVRVAPEATAELESARARLADRAGGAAITVRADPSLSCGDVVIDTELGRIDARLDVQFETIMRALAEGTTP